MRSITGQRSSEREIIGILIILAAALVSVLFAGQPARAETASDVIAPSGCAMAHCDQAMSDNAYLWPPLSAEVVAAWRDTGVSGSFVGVGCSSNGRTAVCSFRSTSLKPVEIRAYDSGGNVLWSSTALSSNAFYSAPMIGPDGGVIAADASKIIRFNAQGGTIWSVPTAGGDPISPNVTDSGEIILATKSGPVSAYDYATGNMLAQLKLVASVRYNGRLYSGFFDTVNTPAIRGNRMYVATQFRLDPPVGFRRSLPVGRLYALDLVRDVQGTYGFNVIWYFEFRGPSGTSPTLASDGEGGTIVFVDGAGTSPSLPQAPYMFAVKDMGASGQLLWQYRMPASPQMSPARDPRGGVWCFGLQTTTLLRLWEKSPEPVQTINVDDLINDPANTFIPYSVMTIAGDETSPVMMVAVTSSSFSITYVSAIDLTSGSLLWKFRVDEGKGFNGMPSGQYPIVINGSGNPVAVFSTRQNGVWALVARP